jgi:hypothetical protein
VKVIEGNARRIILYSIGHKAMPKAASASRQAEQALYFIIFIFIITSSS